MNYWDTDWKEHAACKGQDPRRFDQVDAWTPGLLAAYKETAQECCAKCPVIALCGAYADRTGSTGLWAGAYRSQTLSRCRALIPHAPQPNPVRQPRSPATPGRPRVRRRAVA